MTVRRGGLAVGLMLVAAAALAALFAGRAAPDAARAASHREAPLISLDPAADISDFFLFRSYEPGKADRVVLIMNVNPGEEPSSGPNYYGFDPGVTYSVGIDNDRDGKADDVRFIAEDSQELPALISGLAEEAAGVWTINLQGALRIENGTIEIAGPDAEGVSQGVDLERVGGDGP